jgi:hypothetical protein
VNLPARLKMSKPRYQEFDAGQIPTVRRDDGTVIKVIAGETDGVRGAVGEIAMQPTYLDVHLAPNARFEQPVPKGHAAFAYLYRVAGQLGLDANGAGATIAAPRLAVLGDGDTFIAVAGPEGARFLLVSGAPTREQIARYGPFVMNTRETGAGDQRPQQRNVRLERALRRLLARTRQRLKAAAAAPWASRALVLVSEIDAALGQVVGRHLERDLVPGEDADAVLADLARGVRDHLGAVRERDPEAGVREHLAHDAFHLDQLFLRRGSVGDSARLTADVYCACCTSNETFWFSLGCRAALDARCARHPWSRRPGG